jgi:hypothetical protein
VKGEKLKVLTTRLRGFFKAIPQDSREKRDAKQDLHGNAFPGSSAGTSAKADLLAPKFLLPNRCIFMAGGSTA